MTLPVTPKMKIQALLFRGIFHCEECRSVIYADDKIEWDHGVAVALGGAHDYRNIRPLHKDCHAHKTRGTKATTKGSDIHMIAAAKRIARGGKTRRGPKMKSRGFQKVKRPMRGTRAP